MARRKGSNIGHREGNG